MNSAFCGRMGVASSQEARGLHAGLEGVELAQRPCGLEQLKATL
jgi:hypothetical protein|tara:strand:- start:640 stop:771 length:132 start_codon:yes stop_codon:yes gene_type:complete